MFDLLPLFPLPTAVLFPNVFLPLHVFEPRYREMVADAVRADRMIGMTLLRPGWERDYDGRPAVYPVGCSGVITHVEPLADGRYNIVLRGLDRFRIIEEHHDRSYRRARTETLPEPPPDPTQRLHLRGLRNRLEARIAPTGDAVGSGMRSASGMSDADLVNTLAQYLDLEPIEKQALLEIEGIAARAESLVELIEMKLLMAKAPGGATNVAH